MPSIDLGTTTPILEIEELALELKKTYCEFELNILIEALRSENPASVAR